jgi:hypothetical protein
VLPLSAQFGCDRNDQLPTSLIEVQSAYFHLKQFDVHVAFSLTQDLNDDFAAARAVIKIDEDDLLPSPRHQPFLREWNMK